MKDIETLYVDYCSSDVQSLKFDFSLFRAVQIILHFISSTFKLDVCFSASGLKSCFFWLCSAPLSVTPTVRFDRTFNSFSDAGRNWCGLQCCPIESPVHQVWQLV